MKPRSARVARRVMRSARLRDELAAAKWELRKLRRQNVAWAEKTGVQDGLCGLQTSSSTRGENEA